MTSQWFDVLLKYHQVPQNKENLEVNILSYLSPEHIYYV